MIFPDDQLTKFCALHRFGMAGSRPETSGCMISSRPKKCWYTVPAHTVSLLGLVCTLKDLCPKTERLSSVRLTKSFIIYLLFIYYTVYTHVKSFTIVKNRKCGQVTSHCRKAQPYRADLSLFLNVAVVTVKSEITLIVEWGADCSSSGGGGGGSSCSSSSSCCCCLLYTRSQRAHLM